MTRLAERSPDHRDLAVLVDGCSDCGACLRQCAFLKRYGSPAAIQQLYEQDSQQGKLAFSCSLCGLCNVVCPAELPLDQYFLAMRRHYIAEHPEHLKKYGGLRFYESIGTSKAFSHYALPANCTSVFFPGCALTGSRPERTWELYQHLRSEQPSLGLVLDCCTKPSHDLGDVDRFNEKFFPLRAFLENNGVNTVITACPNCYQVFKRYAPEMNCRSVYEVLDTTILPSRPDTTGTITIHDPCVSRGEPHVHEAVRSLIDKVGLECQEMKNTRKTALCCGEGGCVMAEDKELALSWRQRRADQADQRLVVSYCAGCVDALRPEASASHVLDIVFDPLTALDRKQKSPGSLKRYMNRLQLKKRARKQIACRVRGDRRMTTTEQKKKSRLGQVIVLALLIAAIVTLKMTGAADYLQPEKLRDWIAGTGFWAPLIFMVLYTAAPALFLPGLPLTILGGILFGPFWGVVYTITGATAGACVAFLVARYLGRDWIRSKLTAPRWQKLDEDVARNGWKVVAFTRLIPLFPFNLLNYAFGLTNIRFSHYALTSFICMLPATIAFISLSSSLGELIKGQVSKEFIIGIILVVALSLLPMWWKKRQGKRREEQ
ncbi:VTT domain-containing protein [Desulfuromonas acetoxidans]|uniref:VTT domain-containing protein n=1 Tax=Desulfuromonas acetoxidans TaxID=891 RepID=UPI00292CCA91|nr:VTT domain-containing protein [Desulfuromonas acetoxidans]